MELGEAIRSLRSAAGFTQKEFAKRLEISASYLSLVEAGKREPTISLLRRMASVLGAPAALLFAAALVQSHVGPQFEAERNAVDSLVEAAKQLLVIDRMDPAQKRSGRALQ